ncbi:unnamed protein product [Ceutorhynchus assimilis]|uniref:DUF7869 domain-containing protein n=1 Tax=Ceutorhynchus assimilis TaxID=467358 RepID=A0A9P0DU07_9CUCU|nr:unnamed protein product [Ceutorhynchus assimilis]
MENHSRARTILNLALRSEKVEGSRKRARKNLLSLIKDAESNPAEHLGVSTDRSELLTLQQDGMDSVEEKNEEIDTGCLSNDSMMISCQEEPSSECEVQFSITEMFPEVSPRKAEVTNSNIVATQSNADDITINTAQEDFPAYDISPAVSAIEGLNQIDTAETPIYHEMEPYNITNDGQSPKESLALNDDSNVSEIGILEEGAGKENLILPSTSAGNKRPKRRVKQKSVAYLDYLSDDEVLFTDNDSDVWEEELSSSSEDEVNQNFKGKQKKNINKEKKNNNDAEEEDKNIVGELGKITKKPNKRALKKKAKQSGQEYVKSDGTVVPAKQIKPNPCSGKKCGNNCENISDERRKLIFDHFWNLSVDRRKDWIVAMSQKSMVKRKRSTELEKRQFTFKYFINEGEGKRSICLHFLCNTFDVSQKFIYYTVSNASFGCAQEDLRGKSIPPNKTKEGPILQVMNFIKSLPAVPSHYSRKDSNRLYLPQELKNLSHLYQVYKKNHIEQGIDVVGERVFRNIFNKNFNIGFHVPKKDKCLQCIRFERTDKADENMQKAKQDHETEKNHTYNRFKMHQNIHKTDPTTLCVSFDLQKVLNTPHGESMLLYYSRKISVFNLIFYESGTRDVFCYYWDEVNGKRGANEVGTILNRYINMIDKRESVRNLLLYCDCCPGQNRNKTILSMIHATLQNCKFIETIQINFLLTGHTYMPVDSVHAIIERNTKHSIIWAPSQWFTVFTTARQDPRPYNVEYLSFKDFNKYDVFGEKYFKGNLTGKISKIRICTFKKKDSHKIKIKNSMDDKAPSFDIEVQTRVKGVLTSCYKTPLAISKQKYEDLHKLCKNNVIPPIFHHEYVNLPTGTHLKDTLPDTDIEDEFE